MKIAEAELKLYDIARATYERRPWPKLVSVRHRCGGERAAVYNTADGCLFVSRFVDQPQSTLVVDDEVIASLALERERQGGHVKEPGSLTEVFDLLDWPLVDDHHRDLVARCERHTGPVTLDRQALVAAVVRARRRRKVEPFFFL